MNGVEVGDGSQYLACFRSYFWLGEWLFADRLCECLSIVKLFDEVEKLVIVEVAEAFDDEVVVDFDVLDVELYLLE